MKKILPFLILFFSLLLIVLIVLHFYTGNPGKSAGHTESGRDVTAEKAYQMWQSDMDNVKIIDVRTRAEYALVGHPPMAFTIPLAFWTDRFDPVKKTYRLKANPDFVKEIKNRFSKEDTLLLLCRSGQRSGIAAKHLRNAGFSNVYNITDGFEGSPFPGKKIFSTTVVPKNGWKNSGAPWTYELNPGLVE